MWAARASGRKEGKQELKIDEVDLFLIDLESGGIRMIFNGAEEKGWAPVFPGPSGML
jgi:hypothetical protein